jgi:selenocysteine lyase/cysteine desulfurase
MSGVHPLPVDLWAGARGYLNTASYGLPPRPAWEALQAALADWREGRTSWEPWNDETGRAREIWARLVHVPAEQVAVGATVSELVGLVAAALPRGRVLSTSDDFASLLFPWLVNEAHVRVVPVRELADAVDEQTDVVAFSAVQSSNGEVADLESVASAARAHGAITVVDATHAVGWLPLDASRFDAVACAGYKWLLTPRGTAYLYVAPDLLERVRPLHAGWFSSDDPYKSYFGLPLRLAETARRLDTSPAWFSWVAAVPTLATLEEIGIERIHAHDVALANRFRAGLGLEPSDSAIVSTNIEGAEEKLARAGIRAAVRAGSLRASFHVYNTEDDADAAVNALRAG